MGRLVVRIYSQHDKANKKFQHRHWLKYNVKVAISFIQRLFQILEYLCWYTNPTNIRNRYIYGYFSRL